MNPITEKAQRALARLEAVTAKVAELEKQLRVASDELEHLKWFELGEVASELRDLAGMEVQTPTQVSFPVHGSTTELSPYATGVLGLKPQEPPKRRWLSVEGLTPGGKHR